jgi:hypothetical protein
MHASLVRWLLPLDDYMHRARTRDVVSDLIAQTRRVNALEQAFSGANQDSRNSDMHLVDKSGTKILPHGGNPAAEPHILSICSVDSLFQCSRNTRSLDMKVPFPNLICLRASCPLSIRPYISLFWPLPSTARKPKCFIPCDREGFTI